MLGAALLALGVLFPLASEALVEVRPLTARVHDDAGILSPAEQSALVAALEGFERETRHQIVVLTLKSLEGEAIEDFSLRVAEAWKIGQADLDNGILVIVAAEDRKARIEVGYGLEGVVPDALAARILRDQMIPRFRVGAMGDGVRAGVEALIAAARGEPMPAAPEAADEWARGHRGGGTAVVHGVLIATLLGVFLGSQFARRRRGLAPVASGLLAALAAWFFTFVVPAAIFAALAAAVLSLIFSAGGPRGGFRGGPHVFGPGGLGGGFGGGGFGGGGFGGGGFGGGGGGFGGGGASGSW